MTLNNCSVGMRTFVEYWWPSAVAAVIEHGSIDVVGVSHFLAMEGVGGRTAWHNAIDWVKNRQGKPWVPLAEFMPQVPRGTVNQATRPDGVPPDRSPMCMWATSNSGDLGERSAWFKAMQQVGANVERIGPNGETPLHRAASSGNHLAVETLARAIVDASHNINVENNAGRTAWDLAGGVPGPSQVFLTSMGGRAGSAPGHRRFVWAAGQPAWPHAAPLAQPAAPAAQPVAHLAQQVAPLAQPPAPQPQPLLAPPAAHHVLPPAPQPPAPAAGIQ